MTGEPLTRPHLLPFEMKAVNGEGGMECGQTRVAQYGLLCSTPGGQQPEDEVETDSLEAEEKGLQPDAQSRG